MRIYTRTGDRGETGLFGGRRVPKDHPRVAAGGDVDELNAHLGLALSHEAFGDLREILIRLQENLLILGADLATPPEAGERVGQKRVPRVTADMVAYLEDLIDRQEANLSALTHFILPGGVTAGACLHLARAACRRAERSVVTLAHAETVNEQALAYLNRLSDLLFVLARAANQHTGQAERPWIPNREDP
ncbi:MAG: cob(I)yrinic acid a,c-diamide adenosyltransferase [Armatimonadetes bacterium]|nr:cob(I)yrinic acid a,c-diamide adenosyltransferase [Armatimonadota bacterium]